MLKVQTYLGYGNSKYKWEIIWWKVIVLIVLHTAAIYGLMIKSQAMLKSQIYYKLLNIAVGFGTTAGAHRLWTHRAYKVNKISELLLAWLFSTNYQYSVYHWCRDHRVHHKFTETDADPHNSTRGFFFSHIGWFMLKKHPDVLLKGKTVDMSDLEANPIVMFQHKYYHYIIPFTFILIPTLIPMYFWGESFKYAFFTCTVYRYAFSLHVTLCINSVAHLFGTRPYDKNMKAVENSLLKYLALGEGSHNYHHIFPSDYRTSELGSDYRNVTTFIIDFFAWIGWVKDLRVASREAIEMRKARTGDGSTEPLWYFRLTTVIAFVLYFFIF